MKGEQNSSDKEEIICSEEYKKFLEFHNSILEWVEKDVKKGKVRNLPLIRQIEQQSYDVFKKFHDCQDRLVDLIQPDQMPFAVDYSLEDMLINRYEVCTENSSLQETEQYKLCKKGIVIRLGEKNQTLDEWVESQGLVPVYIPENADDASMADYFNDLLAGVIGIPKKEWTEQECYNFVRQMFFAAKHTANQWYKSKTTPFFVAVTMLGGRFGIDSIEKDFVTGSLSGLCKSAAKEWNSNVSVHYIDTAAEIKDEQLIQYIDNELKYGTEIEVGYPNKDTRLVFKLCEKYENRVDTHHLPQEEDVFLVAGGAEGVTSACIIEFSKRFHSKFILFGMVKLDENYKEEYQEMGREEIREYIIRGYKAKGKKIIYADADKMAQSVLSQRQIHNTLEQLDKSGSEAVYYQCDITDPVKLHDIVKKGVQKLGKITGIIHGAGVLSNTLLNRKTEQEFEKVFGVKYYGINNMMKEVDSKNLKYLFFYSSIAGFFGNFGQADYSCGNEYLNHYARYWSKSHPECKVMSLNWGPWNGGMVDHALKSAMLRRGKILIEPEIGKMFFIDAFAKVWEKSSCQLVINDVDDLGGDF